MDKPLFPKDVTGEYLSQNVVPDDLTEKVIKSHSTTFEKTINHHDKVISLIESNVVYESAYNLQGPSFEFLFRTYEPYYVDQDMNSRNTGQKLELLRREQSIHFLANFSSTQDVSSHLRMTEYFCDQEEIFELMVLLNRKHTKWSKGFSEGFVKWLHFLLPYYKHLHAVSFDFLRLLSIDFIPHQLIKSNIMLLKSHLEKQKIIVSLQEEKLEDLNYLLEEMGNWKKILLEKSFQNDAQFYFGVGMLSLIVLLLRFSLNKDPTFIKACLFTSLYADIFDEFRRRAPSEAFLLTSVPEAKLNINNYKEILKSLCLALKNDNPNLFDKKAYNDILECLLGIINKRKNDWPEFFLCADKTLDPIYLDILDLLSQSKESYPPLRTSYCGIYMNSYEYSITCLLASLLQIQEKVSKHCKNYLKVYQNLSLPLQKNTFTQVTLDYYFEVLRHFAESNSEFYHHVLHNWNLMEVSLQNMIESDSKDHIQEFSINLKHTLKLLKFKAGTRNLLQNGNEVELLNTFKFYINQISQPVREESKLIILKYIGIFLTGVLTLDLDEIKQTRLQFLSSLVIFFTNQCKPTQWDMMQLDFWTSLRGTINFQQLVSDQSFLEFLSLVEDIAARGQFKAVSFPNQSQIGKIPKVKQKTYEIIVSSLTSIETTLSQIYNTLDWKNLASEKEQDKIDIIRLLHRRFIYFTHVWIECFIKIVKLHVKNDVKELSEILQRSATLYFHPAWKLFPHEAELKIQKECFATIVLYTRDIRWQLYQAFYHTANQILNTINSTIQAENQNKEDPMLVCPLSNIELETLISKLCELEHIFEPAEEFPLNAQLEENMTMNFKSIIKILFDFAFNRISLKSIQNTQEQDQSRNSIVDFTNALKSLMRPVDKMKKFQEIVSTFLSDLLISCIGNPQNRYNQDMSTFFINVALCLDQTVRVKVCRILFCQNEIWTFIMQRLNELSTVKTSAGDITKHSKPLMELITILYEGLKTEAQIEQAKKLAKSNNEGASNKDLITDMYLALSSKLEKFPILEMILRNDEPLVQAFKLVLQIFESLYIYITKECDVLQKSMSDLTSIGADEAPEVLQSLEEFKQNIANRFYSNLELVLPFHNFEATKNIQNNKIESTKSLAFNSLQNSLINFSAEIIEGSIHNCQNEDDIIKNTLKMHAYMKLLSDLHKQFALKPILGYSTCWTIFNVSKVIFEQLKQHNFKEGAESGIFVPTLQNMLSNMTRFLLDHCVWGYEQQHNLKSLVELISGWIVLVFETHQYIQEYQDFDIINPKETLLKDITTMLYLFALKEDSVYLILFIMRLIFSIQKKESWKMVTIAAFAFVLEDKLENSLSDTIEIEINVKKLLMNSSTWPSPLKLSDLTNSTYIKEKEQNQITQLVNVLMSKFRIFSSDEHAHRDNSLFKSNLFISIDGPQEAENGFFSIADLLDNLSSNATAIMDLLMDSLLDNFLANMYHISSTMESSLNFKQKYKETGSILTILSMLLQKNRHLVCYVAFKKNDYRSFIRKYQKGMTLSFSGDVEDFAVLTFVELLFRIKYFTYNNGDFYQFLMPLIGLTGVTFSGSGTALSIVDVSVIVINQILRLICFHIKGACREKQDFHHLLENFVEIQSCISMFSFLWHHTRATYKKDVFEKCFKEEFSRGLKLILCSVRDFTNKYSHIPKIYGSLISSLPSQLKRHYDKELSNVAVSDERIQQLKSEHYLQFLQEYQTVKRKNELGFISESLKLNTYMSNRISTQSLVDVALSYNHFTGNGNEVKSLHLPLTNSNYYWGSGPSWKSERTAIISATKDFCSRYNSFGFGVDGEQGSEERFADNLLAYLDWNELGLSDYSQEKWSLSDVIPKHIFLKLEKRAPRPQNDAIHSGMYLYETINFVNLLRWLDILSERLRVDIQEEEEKEGHRGMAALDRVPSPEEIKLKTEINTKPLIKETNKIAREEQKIEYFINLELQSKAKFEFLERQVLQNLKVSSEQILIETLLLEQGRPLSTDMLNKMVSSKLTEQFDALSGFLKHMYICLIDQFEVLKWFEYPSNYVEIKQEFNWIQNNFNEYLNILNAMRVSLKLPTISITNKSVETSNPEFLLMNNFTFCTDHSVSPSQPSPNIVETISPSIIKSIQNLFFIDDKVVESVICCLYSAYEDAFTQSSVVQLLKELSNSPMFETKFLDFCFFFLYCPEHLELDDIDNQRFPYNAILGQKSHQITPCIYSEVSFNILTFLSEYFPRREFIIDQPRVYFEKSSLASLQKLKLEMRYLEKTREMISVCDLIIGLSHVKQIMENPKLRGTLESFLIKIFSKYRRFEIKEFKAGDESIEIKKICTTTSCKTLLKMSKVESIIKNIIDFIPYDPDIIIQMIQKQQRMLCLTVQEALSLIQLQGHPLKADFLKINNLEPDISVLEKILSLLSCSMSTRLIEYSDSGRNDINERKIELFQENFRMMNKEIFENEEMEKFFKNIFELANLLTQFKVSMSSFFSNLMKICIHFSALVCIREEIVQPDFLLKKESPEEADLLVLDYSIWDVSNEKCYSFGKFITDKDETIKLRHGDFEKLFIQIYKSNEEYLNLTIAQDSGPCGLLKAFQLISRKYPWMLGEFDSKRKNLMAKLENYGKEQGYTANRNISIDRMNLVKSTLNAFANQPLNVIRQKIRVTFLYESGSDAGGLTREWLTIITRELFNPNFGLFQIAEDNISLQPSPLAKIIPSHLKYLQLAGMMLAKAIQLGCLTDITLTGPFLKHILRKRITLNDLNDIDTSLTKSLKWILNNSFGGLDHLFTYEMEVFGKRITRELIPDGYSIPLTEANKREFVSKVCQTKLYGNIKEEIDAFMQGFYLIIPAHYLFELNPNELQLLISGPSKIDVTEIKKHAEFLNLASNSPLAQWLWEVLFEFSQEELSAFVLFVSGSPKLPYGGLKDKPFRFRKAAVGPNSLPISHTCSWAIELPAYRSKEELKQKLLLAITEGQGSFMIA